MLPDSKAGQLIDQINSSEASGELLTEIQLQRFISEARKIVKVDSGGGYSALGIVYAMKKDYRQSMQNHQRALTSSRCEEYLYNFALSLFRIGYYKSSIQYMEELYNLKLPVTNSVSSKQSLDREKFDVMYFLAESYRYTGNISKATNVMEEINSQFNLERMNVLSVVELLTDSIASVSSVLKAGSIPESILVNMESEMDALISANDLIVLESIIMPFSDEGIPSIIFKKRINADIETVSQLNDTLISGWIDSEIEPHKSSEFVTAGFLPSII